MAVWDSNIGDFVCECGCGTVISGFNRFKAGHYVRDRSNRDKISNSNKEFWSSAEGLSVRESTGHKISLLLSGRSLSEEHKLNIGKSLEKAYRDNPKLAEDRRGRGNPHWRGGYRMAYGDLWEAQRSLILVRDSYTCRSCGLKGDKFSRLEVHHMDRNTSNWCDSNLVTLCKTCNCRASGRLGVVIK